MLYILKPSLDNCIIENNTLFRCFKIQYSNHQYPTQQVKCFHFQKIIFINKNIT